MPLDIGLGIILAHVLCLAMGIETEWYHMVVGAGFGLLPDLDALPELFQRGKIAAAADSPRDHREGLHYPLIVLPIGAMLAWKIGEYWGILFLAAVGSHFIHDSFGTGWGVKWLWPLSRKNYKFFCEKDNRQCFLLLDYQYPEEELPRPPFRFIVSWTSTELREAIVKHGDPHWLRKYLRSMLFFVEVVFGAVGLTLFLIVLLF